MHYCALLSLDKGNRATSWVWEFDPTHTHTDTHTHTCCTCTLSCSSTGVTSTNAQHLMYPHLYQLHGSFSYAKARLFIWMHCAPVSQSDGIDGTIRYRQDTRSSYPYLSEGFWWNSVWNLLASCNPRGYLVSRVDAWNSAALQDCFKNV